MRALNIGWMLAGTLLLAVGAGADAAAPATPAEQGKTLFAEQKCKLCHSIAGVGNAKGVLDGVGSKQTAEELKAWLTKPKEMAEKAKAERKPPMPSYDKLPAADVDALVAYLQTLKK